MNLSLSHNQPTPLSLSLTLSPYVSTVNSLVGILPDFAIYLKFHLDIHPTAHSFLIYSGFTLYMWQFPGWKRWWQCLTRHVKIPRARLTRALICIQGMRKSFPPLCKTSLASTAVLTTPAWSHVLKWHTTFSAWEVSGLGWLRYHLWGNFGKNRAPALDSWYKSESLLFLHPLLRGES